MLELIIIAGALAVGGFAGITVFSKTRFLDVEKDKKTSSEMILKSQQEALSIKNETGQYVEKRKADIEQETHRRAERIKKLEEILNTKEELLKKRVEKNKELELLVATKKEEMQVLSDGAKKKEKQVVEELGRKTGASIEDVKKDLINRYTKELEQEYLEGMAKKEEYMKENAEKIAKKIIISSIQRLCSPTSVETRAVNVEVAKDHIKGKIVGKNAENILALEKLLTADIVFNDLPNTISISAFNLVERRIAQRTIERLVKIREDITPAVVARAVKMATEDTDKELYEIGKEALDTMEIKHDDKEFIRIVGRLHYRTSYGQNIMKHSMEVGWVAAILGAEIGLNIETCKVGGFLHDLGKAIDQDPNVKDAHDRLSKELMEKYGFSWEEIHAAWTHHDAIPQETPEALIVKAADAVSASRPGARQESIDRYIERIKALEGTAMSREGVKNAFALSAGRELRVLVDPEKVTDAQTKSLAVDLAKTIEKTLAYPGKIKVNIIRRTKHTEIAN